MRFEFKNVGVIDKADLEMGDLTIICGENNTGKTYLTYTIYGFYKRWSFHLFEELEEPIKQELKKSKGIIDLDEMFSQKINQYFEKISTSYTKELHYIFASRKEFFSEAIFKAYLDQEPEKIDFSKPYKKTLNRGEKTIATISKKENSSKIEIITDQDVVTNFGIISFVARAITEIVFDPYFMDVFIASAERTGAAIFYKELDFSRSRLMEKIQSNKSEELDPIEIFKTIQETGYARPIVDNVDFIRNIETLDKKESDLSKKYPQIIKLFEKIVGGSYKFIKNKGLVYVPKNGNKKQFSMSEASSSIRALLDIYFYLRCCAESGDMLILDEPELNLHPTNQRLFARLIALLVNCGIRIFITTHSDYIIRELNTLIMLDAKTKNTKYIQKKHKYLDEELMDYKKIKIFTTNSTENSNGLIKAEIDPKYGIEAKTFDSQIEEINNIQNNILFED